MGDNTKIEWTDATWNPIRAHLIAKETKIGWHCTHVSEGCRNCYAERLNMRLGTGLEFKPGHEKDVEIILDENMLLAPLKWRRARMVFVCSMTDLFADFVPDDWIDKLFAVMALCPQHVFQVLTKRSARMRAYLADPDHAVRWFTIIDDEWARAGSELSFAKVTPNTFLNNLWLGVSCEDQANADARIPDLLATPAAVRFISAEPLLGDIDVRQWLGGIRMVRRGGPDGRVFANPISGQLDWVIAGGESGPQARPSHPDWFRSLRDQCAAAGVPFFFKQWGEWGTDDGPFEDGRDPIIDGKARCAWRDGDTWRFEESGFAVPLGRARNSGQWLYRLGKKAAGRELDGALHDAFPTIQHREDA